MAQKKTVIGAAAFFVVTALLVGYFALAAEIGDKEDPLVSLGYLRSLDPQIEATIEAIAKEKVESQTREITDLLNQAYEKIGDMSGGSSLDASDLLNNEEFINKIAAELAVQISGSTGALDAVSARVEVEAGKTLHLPVGSSIMLRLGTGTVVASNSPGLIDMTTGDPLDNGGTLVANHLYTVTMDAGRDIKCSSKMTVFIWGPYTQS